jgi:hypothetical protein
MGRRVIPFALITLVVPLLGTATCGPTLVSPTQGYLIVPNVFSPVRIQTSGLDGEGRIDALLPDQTWATVHVSSTGSFLFNEPLPGTVWHCSDPGGSEGCVARLRIEHDGGPVGHNPSFGSGIVHVCTERYIQRVGRRHCGGRALERLSGAPDGDDVWLPPASSQAAERRVDPLQEGAFRWRGDEWNRLIWGAHDFKHIGASSPPQGELANDLAGLFFDYRWDPEAEISVALGVPSNADYGAYSMDLGACSFFIPWEWQHRLEEAYYTRGLGAALGDRGLAERFIDEMIDTTEPESRTEVNALLWVDGTVGMAPNQNASPEFHYRLSEDLGHPQMCFKQYFHVSSEISTRPDHWYRFDQAIGAFFLELLPFIGQCGSKDTSFRYCGTPEIDTDGVGAFVIDQSSVQITHQGYPWGKALCNNNFVPKFIDGVRQTFGPGGEGAVRIEEGIRTLVSSLADTLGLDVRRIEMSPRGMYLITAESTLDPQYGMGDCRADLDRAPDAAGASRTTEVYIEYDARGITRF